MVLKVVKYGDPVLSAVAGKVEEVDEEIKELVRNMFETMQGQDGIGLAANQVGILKRVVVIDPSAGEDPEALLVLINPEIISSEGEETCEEGCLSFPEIRFDVSRPESIKVKALNLEGQEVVHEVKNLLAKIFTHEIDHLSGILFIDKLKGLAKEMVLTKIKRMKRNGEWD